VVGSGSTRQTAGLLRFKCVVAGIIFIVMVSALKPD
jgi:hypothetical protein